MLTVPTFSILEETFPTFDKRQQRIKSENSLERHQAKLVSLGNLMSAWRNLPGKSKVKKLPHFVDLEKGFGVGLFALLKRL